VLDSSQEKLKNGVLGEGEERGREKEGSFTLLLLPHLKLEFHHLLPRSPFPSFDPSTSRVQKPLLCPRSTPRMRKPFRRLLVSLVSKEESLSSASAMAKFDQVSNGEFGK